MQHTRQKNKEIHKRHLKKCFKRALHYSFSKGNTGVYENVGIYHIDLFVIQHYHIGLYSTANITPNIT